ncbi:MAG: HEAT repeat domain-containing protein, partial [Candidatus Brocadiales bacterium]|nr:HEAT repeat domain-containing protein [Candidatus Brocadiales bacterium]
MHTSKLKSLINKLGSTDPSVRRASAESLSEGDERAIYPLIKSLRDDNLGVQDAAMRSLMAIKGETTAYMVLPLLRENALLRNTA